MKKRIISIALAIVMVVGMAVTMLTASAYTFLDEASFDVYFSGNALQVDAEMDDVYRMSEQISNAFTYYSKRGGVAFDSWAVATLEGYYAYTVVDDTTVGSEYMEWNAKRGNVNDVSAHDKVQYYFSFKYVDDTSWWGYFETDYYANNVDGEQFANINCTSDKPLHHVRWKQNVTNNDADTNTPPAGVQYATKILRDSTGAEYGWVSEIFIPWNVLGNVPAEQTTLPIMSIGIQANNDNYKEGAAAGAGANDRDGYCYSRYTGTSWWNGDFVNNPLTPLNFSDQSFYDYDVYLTSQHVELDGKMDDVYLNSTMVQPTHQWNPEAPINWNAYTVAGLNGMYIFAHVDDTTMNNVNDTSPDTGDMVQIYLDWSPKGTAHTDPGVTWEETSAYREYPNKVYGSWMGWFQADYEGYFTGTMDTSTQWLRDYGADVAVNKIANPNWDGMDSKAEYIGYDIEFFIPYNDYMQYVVDTQSFADYHFSIGFQVNDDATYGDKEERTSIAVDTADGMSYWDKLEWLPEARLVPDANLPKHASGTTVSTVALDGANTNGEYDNAQVIHVNLAGSGNADAGDIYRVICDGNYVYVLMEMVDTTPHYTDAPCTDLQHGYDYNDVYIGRYGSYDASWSGSYTSVNRKSNDDNTKVVDNGANGWSVEKRYELTAAEKAQFARGELVFAVAMQYQDCIANGSRAYKYDNDQGGVFYNGGGNTYAQGFHKFVFAANSTIAPDLTSASVVLGEDITMNYYATLGNADTDAKLKVTMNDKITYVGAQATDIKNEYKFAFEGIAPQCMGDNIKAELVVNGKIVETKTDYSVLANVAEIAEKAYAAENWEEYDLVCALLDYGAAAQVYAKYKTTALVNEEYTLGGVDLEENNDREYSDALADGHFTAVGVYHANANKLYAKFVADDIANVTVTINGEEVAFELYKYSKTEYIVYTDDIKVTEFDEVFEFVLDTAAGEQTLTYSVNAYADAKWDAADDATAALAQALYAYGVMAEAYIAG